MDNIQRIIQSLFSFTSKSKQTLKDSLTTLGKQKALPHALRNKLKAAGQKRAARLRTNRRKEITPELKQFIKNLQTRDIPAKTIHDCQELSHYSYIFDADYYKSQLEEKEANALKTIGDIILHYCTKGSKNGINPSEVFDTYNYLSKNPKIREREINPLIHFFNRGIHRKRLSMDEIHFMRKIADIKKLDPNSARETKEKLKGKKIGVFLHIFYPKLATSIASYLKNIPCKYDIFISTRKEFVRELEIVFGQLNNANKIEIKHFKNTGRDVAPFFAGFREHILNYDIILKLHSKKSPHSSALNGWFIHCLDNLIGNEIVTLTNLKALLSPDTGAIYPVENYTISLGMKYDSCWGYEDKNFKKAESFLKKFKLNHIKRESIFRFPVGTMFWCKPEALKPIIDWNIGWEHFDEEEGQIDGTLAHSIERIIGLSITEIYKLKAKSTYCGYSISEQYIKEKSSIEHQNEIKISGFEKVIHFRPRELEPTWSINSSIQSNSLSIHWVIPHFTPGLGGHMTIFRTIEYLERCGHKCTIWIHSELTGNNKSSRLSSVHKRIIEQHFISLKTDEIYMLGNDQEDLDRISGDVVIATDRMSTYPVLGMRKFLKRFYFVQDYEPYFFAKGSASILTELSYASKNQFSCICASPWLKQKMESFGNKAISFPLAVDQDIYNINTVQERSTHTIAFYVRRSTPRRLYELGLLALRALFDLGDYFEVITFGEDDLPKFGIPVKVIHAGILEGEELAKLYQRCTVGLVLSGTNYSLVPNEMMACGLPVVDIDAEHTRLSYQPKTAVLAEPTPLGLAESLSRLLNDSAFWRETANAGQAATSQLSWDSSNQIVESFIKESLSPIPAKSKFKYIADPLVTVVIPVYNGGAMLKDVVESCLSQDLNESFEVLLIDSSSSDGCLEALPRDERLRLHRIRKEDFGHGRTRNLGVELAKGKYVAFITQDAIPANRMWLMNLIAPLQKDPNVAGVFGCHIAHTEHGQLTAHDLDQHFNRWIFRSHSQPIKLDINRQTPTSDVMNHEHFYSDNNSCLRKSAWKKVPLPEVLYGEDQLWAREILRKGYKKAYASTAVVRHSHEYGFRETLVRANTEWHFYNDFLNKKLPSTKQEVLQMVEGSCKADLKARSLYPNISDEDISKRRRLHFARACGYYLASKGYGGISP